LQVNDTNDADQVGEFMGVAKTSNWTSNIIQQNKIGVAREPQPSRVVVICCVPMEKRPPN